MSVIVKGMEMPEKCQNCNFMQYYPADGNIWCYADNRLMKRGCFAEIDIDRPADCPLVEVKTPHGRLADVDDLITAFPVRENSMSIMVASVRATINHAPTVIEAEEDQKE